MAKDSLFCVIMLQIFFHVVTAGCGDKFVVCFHLEQQIVALRANQQIKSVALLVRNHIIYHSIA